MFVRCFFLSILLTCLWPHAAQAQSRKAPPGVFKDLNDAIIGDALIIRGKQLFIDDHVIDDMQGVRKQLHQPVKYENNPVLKRDKPWEKSGPGYGTIIYDAEEKRFKAWYENWNQDEESTAALLYATSLNGIDWHKELVDKENGTNVVVPPNIRAFQASGIMKDRLETDPAKRYKMLFVCKPDGTAKSLMTSAAYSADGIQWTAYPDLPIIPFSDTQSCPFWDVKHRRYVALLRFGPPNTRIVSRIESEDFLTWSPKVTVMRRTRIDVPLNTQFYQTAPFAYGNYYFGVMAAYHNESLKPITDEAPWTDRKNLHLIYSRNGLTWSRVGKNGAIPTRELNEDKDWKQIALDAVFLPYGERDKEWDWGTVSPIFTPQPIIVNDEIWFYYTGIDAKNWWTWSGDPPKLDPMPKEPNKGIGVAKLRVDGFVSIDAGTEMGTLTTKPLVFLGDTLVVNANAEGGSLVVEALDADGKPIEGFTRADCAPINTDSVRHIVTWKGNPDCHLLQARSIKLRFHLKNAKLFSIEPAIRHNHYLQSYD
jgi:hypothetical protein